MKKIMLSVLVCYSLSCFGQDESISPEKEIEKLVTVGIEVVQNAEVQEAVIQLHQAYLHFLEVVLHKIASEFGPEERALAQVGLNCFAELAKEPAFRFVANGGDPKDIDEEMQKQLEEKFALVRWVVEAFGPELQKIMKKKVMVTKSYTYTDMDGNPYTCSTTNPKPEYLHFILDRIIEALELAQKSVQ